MAQQRTNRVAIHVMGPATVEVVVQDADDRSQPFPPKSSQITIQVQTDASSSSAGMAVAKSSLHPLIAQLLSVIHPDAERQKILAADAKGPLAEVPGRHGSGAQPSPKSQSIPVRTGALSVSSEAASDHPDALVAMVSPSATRRQEPSTSAERGQDKGPIAVESDRKSNERNGFGVFNRQDPTAKVKPSLVGFDPSSCIQGDGHASTQTQDVALDPSQRLGALQAAGQSAAAQAQRAGQHTPQGGPGGPSATWFFWAVGGALIGFCAAGLALLFGR